MHIQRTFPLKWSVSQTGVVVHINLQLCFCVVRLWSCHGYSSVSTHNKTSKGPTNLLPRQVAGESERRQTLVVDDVQLCSKIHQQIKHFLKDTQILPGHSPQAGQIQQISKEIGCFPLTTDKRIRDNISIRVLFLSKQQQVKRALPLDGCSSVRRNWSCEKQKAKRVQMF